MRKELAEQACGTGCLRYVNYLFLAVAGIALWILLRSHHTVVLCGVAKICEVSTPAWLYLVPAMLIGYGVGALVYHAYCSLIRHDHRQC